MILWLFIIVVFLACIISFILPSEYRVSTTLVPGWLERNARGDITYVDNADNIDAAIRNGSYGASVVASLNLDPTEYLDALKFNTKKIGESQVIYVQYLTAEPQKGKQIVEELLRQLNLFYNDRVSSRREKIATKIIVSLQL